MVSLILLFAILGILWFADELLTILDVKKFGLSKEENPFIRGLLEKGKGYFTTFKILSFAVVVGILWFVSKLHADFAFWLAISIIVLYVIVVVRNFEIYRS